MRTKLQVAGHEKSGGALAHAPGQLDFLGYGAQRALDAEVPIERIVNTWSAERLFQWTSGG